MSTIVCFIANGKIMSIKISCYDIRLCPLTNKPLQTTVDEGESEDQDPRRKPNKRALR